jgi:hypothetical protein
MKRVLALCCLTLWTGATASAQTPAATTAAAATPAAPSAAPATAPAAPPDVVVLKHSWSKERINWESDPFGGPVETFDDVRRRQADQRRIERARATGNTAEAAKVEREMRSEQVIKARSPAPPRYAFLYKISVRNEGTKAVKEIDWDYVFTDSMTGEEVGRREFTGVEKIAPGKSKELSFTTPAPPARRISVHALDKRERAGLNEQVVLVRVLYEDGTVWQRP